MKPIKRKAPAASGKVNSSSAAKPSGANKDRPSDKLNPKTVDPFANKVHYKTTFSATYVNGGIPCRLIHGSVKHSLQWTTEPEELPYDPLIVTMTEGLREIVHPYAFIVRNGLIQMLQATGAPEKTIPLLPKLIPYLRQAMEPRNVTMFNTSLEILNCLSDVVGPELNIYLKTLLPQLANRIMNKEFKDSITATLQRLEQNGGKDTSTVIKSKVPTYSSIYY